MKFKIGDKVRVKSIKDIEASCQIKSKNYYIDPLGVHLLPDMIKQTGKIFTIKSVLPSPNKYTLEEVGLTWTPYILEIVNHPSINDIY